MAVKQLAGEPKDRFAQYDDIVAFPVFVEAQG